MKPASVFLLSCLLGSTLLADDLGVQARQLENKGDAAGARALLERSVKNAPGNLDALTAYAEFLDRHKDPGAGAAYEQAAAASARAGNQARQREMLRRAAIVALIQDDRALAGRSLAAYREAGGSGLSLPTEKGPQATGPLVSIPGPIRSFSRMAALAPDLDSVDTLSALARNVVTNGYQAGGGSEGLEQTEYLKLVIRYLSQARELDKLSGADKTIKIETCESSQTADLLKVLGYRMRGGCGSEVVLETVNATRAFLTIDSGFPLSALEQALRTNRPFVYDYHPTQVPVLYGSEYWMTAHEGKATEFIDAFVSDPSLCRLYIAMSKLDRNTAKALRDQASATRLKAFSHVLDFYGGMFQIRDGKAVIPGGDRFSQSWNDLVGASPDKGAQFFDKLIAREDGWMAAYFDALSRIEGPVRDYLSQPQRLKRFYAAIRGKVTSPGPARPVFRANTDMMLLTTRLRLEADGRPHVPGNIEVWRNLFIKHPHGKYDGKLTKSAAGWKEPDDLLEALFALCRKAVENEPLKIYMALSEINRRRATPLAAETVDRLAREYHSFGSQYSIFAEAPTLRDATILEYMDNIAAINKLRDQGFRSDVAGTMQGLVGLWQIANRQGSLPPEQADETLNAILKPFGEMRTGRELFDAGRNGINAILKAANSPDAMNAQDRVIDLLAGATSFGDDEAHLTMITDMLRIFEAQRLIPVNHLFELADHLDAVAKGTKLDPAIVKRVSQRIAEIQPARASLSSAERTSLAFGYWTDRHVENERKLNLRALTERTGDQTKLADVRGMLAPLLRDTIVGYNYLAYAPPGAQILHTNPLFVRSHDFVGSQGTQQTWRQTEVFGNGWPSSAGGRLVGSLAGLPYALAEAEQNFLIPSREQALIWGDLVPQMILTSKVPRWWKVTPSQTHWVALHMRLAESALAESAMNAEQRARVLQSLSRFAPPARVERVDDLLAEGRVKTALESVTPSEMFAVAADLVTTQGIQTPLAEEIRAEAKGQPELTYPAISRAFGTPKPTLAHCYQPELLNLRTFPTLMGYSSRIMAESWESTLLYYAALSDELHLPPAQLNVSVPEWTRATVERIFATHLEDWPALLRSLRTVGEDERAKMRKASTTAAGGGE